MTKQNKSRKETGLETKRQLANTAMTLFSTNNYESVKITDICKAAGVSVGAFYHHFASKEDILNEGHREFDEMIDETLAACECETSLAKLKALIRIQMTWGASFGYKYVGAVYGNQLIITDKYTTRVDRRYNQLKRELIEKANADGELRLDLSSRELSRILDAITRGMIYNWCLAEGKFDLCEETLWTLQSIFPWFPRG